MLNHFLLLQDESTVEIGEHWVVDLVVFLLVAGGVIKGNGHENASIYTATHNVH